MRFRMHLAQIYQERERKLVSFLLTFPVHELIAEKCDCECAGIYQPLQNYHSCNHWNFVLTFLIGCNNNIDFGHLSIIAEVEAKSTPVCNVKLDIFIKIILRRAQWYKTIEVFLSTIL